MKSLKNQIVLVEMLLEALKELENFYIRNKDNHYIVPEKARVNRLRIEVQKELFKVLNN